MPVQNGMGEPALDYHVSHKGLYAAIEAKALGKKPTPRQVATMRKVRASGGSVFLIDSIDCIDYAQLIGWLLQPFVGFNSTFALKEMEKSDALRDDRSGDAEHEE